MPYTTARIDRRNLVRLAGWGMTGLRPPGRGNMRAAETAVSRLAAQAPAVQASIAAAHVESAKTDLTGREQA